MTGPDLPQHVELAPGATHRVRLGGAAGGYRWTVSVRDDDVASASVAPLGPSPSASDVPAGGPPPSGGGREYELVLTAGAAGRTELRVRLARSWEPDAPVADATIDIRVLDA